MREVRVRVLVSKEERATREMVEAVRDIGERFVEGDALDRFRDDEVVDGDKVIEKGRSGVFNDLNGERDIEVEHDRVENGLRGTFDKGAIISANKLNAFSVDVIVMRRVSIHEASVTFFGEKKVGKIDFFELELDRVFEGSGDALSGFLAESKGGMKSVFAFEVSVIELNHNGVGIAIDDSGTGIPKFDKGLSVRDHIATDRSSTTSDGFAG